MRKAGHQYVRAIYSMVAAVRPHPAPPIQDIDLRSHRAEVQLRTGGVSWAGDPGVLIPSVSTPL